MSANQWRLVKRPPPEARSVILVGGPRDGERIRVREGHRHVSLAVHCGGDTWESHVYTEVDLTENISVFAHSSRSGIEDVAEALVKSYKPDLPEAPEIDWRPNQVLPEDYYAG